MFFSTASRAAESHAKPIRQAGEPPIEQGCWPGTCLPCRMVAATKRGLILLLDTAAMETMAQGG
jgi:hypothetical protein